MVHIDKDIYKQSGVSRRHRPLHWWSIALSILGIVTTILYFLLGNMSQGFSSAILTVAVCCDLVLVTVVCYWLFGDSRAPYSKAGKCHLDRELNYYAATAQGALTAALEAKDIAALRAVKFNAIPALAVITYSSPDGTINYSQLLKVQGTSEVPLTEVVQL